MSDFIYLYRVNGTEQRERMGTPEQAQKSMQLWMTWMRDLEAKGHLKAAGQPLEGGGKVVRKGQMVTDGPFVEAKDLVSGFSVITARDLAQAAELANGCPILQSNTGSVEIRPVMQMAG